VTTSCPEAAAGSTVDEGLAARRMLDELMTGPAQRSQAPVKWGGRFSMKAREPAAAGG